MTVSPARKERLTSRRIGPPLRNEKLSRWISNAHPGGGGLVSSKGARYNWHSFNRSATILTFCREALQLAGDQGHLAHEGKKAARKHKIERQKREQAARVAVLQFDRDDQPEEKQHCALIGNDSPYLRKKHSTAAALGQAARLQLNSVLEERVVPVGANFLARHEEVRQESLKASHRLFAVGGGLRYLSPDKEAMQTVKRGESDCEGGGSRQTLPGDRRRHNR